ncbi:GNAT family N-acetyltransferase [Reinekea forsetii]|nr:GNAT family N-acetyltransferase [Reinekea forsetii]
MIRAAKHSDLKEWSRMRTLLWPDTPDCHVSEIQEYFDGRSPDIVEVLVLDLHGKNQLQGFLELNVRSYAEGSRNRGVPFVEAWYVDEKERNLGWGKKLMEAAEKWSLDKGYSELGSDTELENTESQKAHLALGFKEVERVVCYLKILE